MRLYGYSTAWLCEGSSTSYLSTVLAVQAVIQRRCSKMVHISASSGLLSPYGSMTGVTVLRQGHPRGSRCDSQPIRTYQAWFGPITHTKRGETPRYYITTHVWLLNEHVNARKKTVMGRAAKTSSIETLPTMDSASRQRQAQI